MQFFYWLALLLIIGLAVFAVQNSTAPAVEIKFLLWSLKTSLIYSILGAIVLGVFMTLLLWIPKAIQGSLRAKKLNKEIEELEKKYFREGERLKEL